VEKADDRRARGWGAVPQVNLRSKSGEGDMLVHHLQHIIKLVQLSFILPAGKQTSLAP
jgi:hypothetical protein